jgi:hypothetical protein
VLHAITRHYRRTAEKPEAETEKLGDISRCVVRHCGAIPERRILDEVS